jgi:hypothetical protein
MNDSQRRNFETLNRIEGFGAEHANDFAVASLGKQLFTEISTIVGNLQGYASSQAAGRGSARQGTSTRGAAREQLRTTLETIARTARGLAFDIEGIADKFRVPHNNSDQELLAAARAFAVAAAPISAQFIARELPPTFLQDLQDDIEALESAIDAQASGKGDRLAARADLDAQIDAGLIARRKLDPIVRNKYASNPGILAEWLSASHTERGGRRKGTSPPPPPASGQGTPTPAS